MIALYVLLGLLAVIVLANLIFGRLPRKPASGGGIAETSFGGVNYLEQMGEGPTIIFIHGMPGISREFDEIRARLPGRHTIAFDRPGYNWSTGKPLAFSDQVDAIREAAGTLGVERAVLVGHSFGGVVSLGLAIRHGDFVDRLLLLAPAAGGTRVGPERERQARIVLRLEQPGVRQLADLFFLRLVRRIASQRGAEVAYGAGPETARQRHLAESVLARHNSIRALMNDRLIFNEAERTVTRGLKRISVPALILHGRSDMTVPARNGQRLAAALPQAELEEIDGDHQLPAKNPDACVAALERVLAR